MRRFKRRLMKSISCLLAILCLLPGLPAAYATTVESVTYTTEDINALYATIGNTPAEARGSTETVQIGDTNYYAIMYKPANYVNDGSVIYDVVVYLAGHNNSSGAIYQHDEVVALLDYLSYTGAAEPFLFFSFGNIGFQMDYLTTFLDIFQNGKQNQYPVYSVSNMPADGSSVRDHYALCGYSRGAIMIGNQIMPTFGMSSFSSFGFFSGSFSGCSIPSSEPIRTLITSHGDGDEWEYDTAKWSADRLADTCAANASCARIVKMIGGYVHSSAATLVAPLWEFLQRAFAENPSAGYAGPGISPSSRFGFNRPLADIDDDSWWYNANCIYSAFSVYFREELGLSDDQSDMLIAGILGCVQAESGLDPSRLEGLSTERYAYSPSGSPTKFQILQNGDHIDEFYAKYLHLFGDQIITGATSGYGRTVAAGGDPNAWVTAAGYLTTKPTPRFFLGGVSYFQWTADGALKYWTFCQENNLIWGSPEAALVYMLTPESCGGDRWRIEKMMDYPGPEGHYGMPHSAKRAAEVLSWCGLYANTVTKQNFAEAWYARIKNPNNATTASDRWLYVWNRATQSFDRPVKTVGAFTQDFEWGRQVVAKAKSITSGGTYSDDVLSALTRDPSTYEGGAGSFTGPVAVGFVAFSSNTAEMQSSFAREYGWNHDAMTAAQWIGHDGETHTRTNGFQTENFNDKLKAAESELADLGILPKYSGYGGGTIVEIALREASALDSAEVPLGSNNIKYNWWRYNTSFIDDPTGAQYAWCANFVAWCANEAGYIDSGLFDMSENVRGVYNYQTGVNGFEAYSSIELTQFGGTMYTAMPGDIWCFDAAFTHIGIVTSVTDTTVTVTQGNTNHRVLSITYNVGSLSQYDIATSQIIHVVYPEAEPDPTTTQPAGAGT